MPVPVDAYASEPQYAAHVRPIFDALDDPGTFFERYPRGDDPVIVASYKDLLAVNDRPVIFCEHGAGQTYGAGHSSFAGGRDHQSVVLFLTPSRRVGDKWRAGYPNTPVVEIGVPCLDGWHSGRFTPHDGSVCISFHWDSYVCPESRSAFDFYEQELPALTRVFKGMIGHGHPRIFKRLAPIYERAGIEPVRSFAEVLDRASIYVADNTSTLYEFASTDRPVVVLNAPWYRRSAHHGLRFWEMADVGLRCETPSELMPMIHLGLIDPIPVAKRRREIVAQVYEATDGHGAARAAAAIAMHVGAKVP